MAKKKKIEATQEEPGVPEREALIRATFHLPPELVDRVRDVAWWERRTCAQIVKDAIEIYIEGLVKERRKPFPKRAGELRRGKPIG